jgi:hypothetical protein
MNLIDKAMEAPKQTEGRKRHGKWLALIPVIKILRRKGYTFEQVSVWLSNEGVKCNKYDVSQAYNRYVVKNKEIK